MNKREVKEDPLHETACLSINDVISCCYVEEEGILILRLGWLTDLAKEKTGL